MRFLGLLFLMTAVAGATATDRSDLTIGLNAEFDTLNPIVNSMMAAIYIGDATARRLVVLTPTGEIKPLLIKEVPTLKNKKAVFLPRSTGRGLKIALEILPEAQWADGSPLTCQDVKATWTIGLSPHVSTPHRAEYENIEAIHIDATNPKKCDIIFKEAQPDYYLNLPWPVPAHLEMKVFEEHKDQDHGYERNSLYVRNPSHPGLYNGPYRVSEIKNGSHVTLVRNEKYFGKAGYFKKIIFKFILNSATMEAQLLSGAVDLLSSSGFSFDQALSFDKKVQAEKLSFDVLFVPAAIYSHLDFNLEHPALNDVRVRRALASSLDREEIVKAFFEGRQKTALHFSTPLDRWYTEDPKLITTYPYDKARAQRWLDEAGWKMGPQGVRLKNGQKLSLTLVGAADLKLNEMLQIYIQNSWKKIGVEVLTKNYPARVLFSEILRKRQFEVGFYSWVQSPNSSQRTMLHSKMIPSAKNSWSGNNRPGWKNAQVDQWLDQVETQFDEKKRIHLMRKIMKAYTEELPALPLYLRSNNSVIPKDLKNYRMSPHSFSEYLEVENWRY